MLLPGVLWQHVGEFLSLVDTHRVRRVNSRWVRWFARRVTWLADRQARYSMSNYDARWVFMDAASLLTWVTARPGWVRRLVVCSYQWHRYPMLPLLTHLHVVNMLPIGDCPSLRVKAPRLQAVRLYFGRLNIPQAKEILAHVAHVKYILFVARTIHGEPREWERLSHRVDVRKTWSSGWDAFGPLDDHRLLRE